MQLALANRSHPYLAQSPHHTRPTYPRQHRFRLGVAADWHKQTGAALTFRQRGRSPPAPSTRALAKPGPDGAPSPGLQHAVPVRFT